MGVQVTKNRYIGNFIFLLPESFLPEDFGIENRKTEQETL